MRCVIRTPKRIRNEDGIDTDLMTESAIQRAIMRIVQQLGGLCFRLNSGTARSPDGTRIIHLCPKGTPDLLVIHRTGILWVECKAPNGKLSPAQQRMIETLRNYGQHVIVAQSENDVLDALGIDRIP